MVILHKGRRRNKNGFTLIELMIVIAIVGILAAILTPILMRARFMTYHSACVQNERNLGTALELYALENAQLFPDDLADLTLTSNPVIKSIETCPSAGESYTTTYTVDADNKGYLLACPGAHELQLVGLVEPDYPQIRTGIINQYGPNN